MKDKFNYTARETIHYICPCCAAEWQTNKLEYCPNCEVKMLYSAGEGYHDVEEFYKEDDSAGEEVWISVNDRLPRKGTYVLVYIPGKVLEKACIGEHDVWIFSDSIISYSYTKQITHWTYLPSPPNR